MFKFLKSKKHLLEEIEATKAELDNSEAKNRELETTVQHLQGKCDRLQKRIEKQQGIIDMLNAKYNTNHKYNYKKQNNE
jgi:peptidoglycan hydrolase CwlO-like protein